MYVTEEQIYWDIISEVFSFEIQMYRISFNWVNHLTIDFNKMGYCFS